MKIALLFPRLDCTFKEGPVPEVRGYIPPIRTHWLAFAQKIIEAAAEHGHQLINIEKPLWQFTPKFVRDVCKDFDLVLMPHKQKGDDYNSSKLVFYMQTVFPHLFTVDRNGWGANLSFLPVDPTFDPNADKFFSELQKRIQRNESKFEQPNRAMESEFDVLFVCQIPHDETIKYHSDISVLDALRGVLETSADKGYSVIVKGHPVNPASMSELRSLTAEYERAYYVDDISIHSAIKQSSMIAMVNSGVGFEAMLHEKPIFTYGRSEYENVVNYKKEVDKNIKVDITAYKSFLYNFCQNHTFNTVDREQFIYNYGKLI